MHEKPFLQNRSVPMTEERGVRMWLVSDGVNSRKVRKSMECLRDLSRCKYYQLDLRSTGMVQNGARSLNPQTSVG